MVVGPAKSSLSEEEHRDYGRHGRCDCNASGGSACDATCADSERYCLKKFDPAHDTSLRGLLEKDHSFSSIKWEEREDKQVAGFPRQMPLAEGLARSLKPSRTSAQIGLGKRIGQKLVGRYLN